MRISKQLHDDLIALNLVNEFCSVSNARSYEDALKHFKEFEESLNKNFKKLALVHHPDRGGDENKMKEISESVNRLRTLKVQKPRPRPIVRIINLSSAFGSYQTSSTTSSFYTYVTKL